MPLAVPESGRLKWAITMPPGLAERTSERTEAPGKVAPASPVGLEPGRGAPSALRIAEGSAGGEALG